MTKPWLTIIGIGEDGVDGLSPAALALVESAQVIIGGDRHQNLIASSQAERIVWPSPFDTMIETIKSHKGKRVVILVTGDPLWYSVGARIGREIDPAEIDYHPQLSAFQLAASRLGWSLADVETLTVHGRSVEQIVPYFMPGGRLLILTKDKTSPPAIAHVLKKTGYGPSKMTVLAAMGGDSEARFDGIAETWSADVPDFHLLAVTCIAGPDAQILPRTGLPDEAFVHDGKLTKRVARALALSKLVPLRGQLLWDVGCGCGSIAIEWMRGAAEAQAIGLDHNAERRAMAAKNALELGVPKLHLMDLKAPEGFEGLPEPDAVFIGGGLSESTIVKAISQLKPHGRLVAHAVTLQSEAILLEAYGTHGGELQRIAVESAAPVGPFDGWKPSMTVTQWAWRKQA